MFESYVPMVRDALRRKAPRLFLELQACGELDSFLRQRANEIAEAIGKARANLIDQRKVLSKPDYMTRVEELTEIDRTVRETVFHDMLEFPPDDPGASAAERLP